jgi:hypothetical protein
MAQNNYIQQDFRLQLNNMRPNEPRPDIYVRDSQQRSPIPTMRNRIIESMQTQQSPQQQQ